MTLVWEITDEKQQEKKKKDKKTATKTGKER